MTKLSDKQLVILSAAAPRAGGCVLPLPSSLVLNKGAATLVLDSLLRKGLVAEIAAALDDEVWRVDDQGERLTLMITDRGLAALGIENGSAPEHGAEGATDLVAASQPVDDIPAAEPSQRNAPNRTNPPSPPDAPKPAGKIALLLDLLQRKDGATIAEMTAATGWQAHSVRGAISGTIKKKFRLAVAAETVDGRGRVYRMADHGSAP